MKFIKNSLIIMAFLTHIAMQGETIPFDSVSVEEMRQIFYGSERNCEHPQSLNRFSRYLLGGKFTDNNDVIADVCGVLPYKKYPMPVSSTYVLYGDHANTKDAYQLFWQKEKNAKQNDAAGEFLAKKYGQLNLGDTLCLVPARWVNGTFYVLEYSFDYFGMVLSSDPCVYSFQKGVEKRYRKIDLGKSELKTRVRRLENKSKKTNPQIAIVVMDAPPLKVAAYRQKAWQVSQASLSLFSSDVMRLCREEREAPRSEFSLLFHYDSQRRLHVVVLLPKELNEEERRRMDELQRAVALQPPGLFSSFFTIDGRVFPGMYVKATYERGRWRFEDYRFLNLKG